MGQAAICSLNHYRETAQKELFREECHRQLDLFLDALEPQINQAQPTLHSSKYFQRLLVIPLRFLDIAKCTPRFTEVVICCCRIWMFFSINILKSFQYLLVIDYRFASITKRMPCPTAIVTNTGNIRMILFNKISIAFS